MTALQYGAFRLFRVAGITVSMHWSWILIAIFRIQYRQSVPGPMQYEDGYRMYWAVLEYVSLFAIVLMHEFGHVLACRQVGGIADRIVLWPLGGVAYVQPPPRPGAVLWSIVAGPLVNVILVPVTVGLAVWSWQAGWYPDLTRYLTVMAIVNGTILIFNLLPVYPLDGGQILMSILWFFIGRIPSLMAVSIVGMLFGGALLFLALLMAAQPGGLSFSVLLLLFLIGFIVFRSFVGFQHARMMMSILNRPRHTELACPECGGHPLKGLFWVCDHCQHRFDTFDERGVCPNCWERYHETFCVECYQRIPIQDWFPTTAAPSAPPPQPLPTREP